jgi:hypothetical protein
MTNDDYMNDEWRFESGIHNKFEPFFRADFVFLGSKVRF